jgi:Tfp pilus assembly protein PilN
MAIREVNLIPSEMVARREFQRHLFFWTGLLVISLSLTWGFYFYQKYRTLAEKDIVIDLKQKHLNLAATIDEINRMRAELNALRQRQAGLGTMAAGATYSHTLAELADAMNDHTWLSQLLIETGLEEETKLSLRLTGFSLSAEELGNFLNQLSSEPLFKKVVLQNAREYESPHMSKRLHKTVRLIRFDIACYL